MAGITLAQAEAKVTTYLDAIDALLTGAQSYSIAGRTVTRANLKDLEAGLKFWEGKVIELSPTTNPRVTYVQYSDR